MYTVIEKFQDKDGTIYSPGDTYEATKRRINELLGRNKYNRPFIEEAPDQQED